jgi:LysR family transcriptional regulator, hydrogen peroxide-inducible genes activator
MVRQAMNLRDLKYLVAVAEYGHFRKAAESCFVSQPGLSVQIKKLETTLGIQLIERTNKTVLLTESGHAIAAEARQILQLVDEMYQTARSYKDPYSGELKLGIIPTIAPYLLPYIMQALSHTFPNLTIYLVEEQTALLLEKLKTGKIHAALLALPVAEKNITASTLFEEDFFLAVSSKDPLAKRKSVNEADLSLQNLILLEEGHCLREQTLVLCQKLRVNENKNFQATSLETLRHMVAMGVGITLMPEIACKKADNIRYLPFDQPKPTRTVGLVWRTASAKQLLLLDVADLMKKSAQGLLKETGAALKERRRRPAK